MSNRVRDGKRERAGPEHALISRRGFISGIAAALVEAPLAAEVQPATKLFRIGFLRAGRPPETLVEAFRDGLREHGYVDGQNVVVDYRFSAGGPDLLPRLAEELVRLNVEVIVASSAPATLAAREVTRSVPIIFVGVNDPAELGLIPRLDRPGANVTGLAISATELAGKRLAVLTEVVPKLRRVAVLWDPANPGNHIQLKGAEVAAHRLRVRLHSVPIQGPEDFARAYQAAQGADGVLQVDGPLVAAHRRRLAEIAVARRLPTVYSVREFVEAGGLISYGAQLPDLYRRAAGYVDKILKGANPGDLPVEQPTRFELAVNLTTARALRLTIAPSLLLRADQVID